MSLEIFSSNYCGLIGKSDDITPGGMFINAEDPLKVGTKLILEFTLPNRSIPIKTYSEVKFARKCTSPGEKPSGMEVRFLTVNENDRKKIEEYICEGPKKIVDSDVHTLADFINIPDPDLFAKTRPFREYIEDYKRKGYYIYRKILISPSNNRALIFDETTGRKREIIMMGNSNYLGLASHPKVIEAAKKALQKYGSGPVGSPLHTGSYEVHRMLEHKIAQMKGCEDAMTFSSGYSANVGSISALVRKGDCTIIDRLSHASIIDGCMLSGSTFRTFKHSDMGSLRRVLEDSNGKNNGKLIIVDGVYSTEGDLAPLPDIVEVAREYDAKIMVDDAHGTGVVGDNGKGTVNHFKMEGQVDVVMGTFSKTLAGVGGFVASSNEVINYLRHYARSAFFSASIPPSVAASVLAAIEVMESEPERHENLWKNINYMKHNLKALGYNVPDTQSALVPVVIGNDLLVKQTSKRIFEEGVYLSVFPYPAVPRGQERLRLSIIATHTNEDLDRTLEIFEKVGKEFEILDRDGTGDVVLTSAA